jgi:thiol-disulfide isomerase/thioredoxin
MIESHMKNIRKWLFLLLILAVSGCTKKEKPQAEESITQSGKTYIPEVINVATRTGMVPSFSWKDGSGTQVNFDSIRGKVTLINFWATWCGPCKKELPDLIALSKELADRHVVILGISTDRVTSDVGPFVTEHKIPYTVILSNEDLETAFGNIRVVPTSFLINSEGKIVTIIVGTRTKEQFREAILAAL